MFIVSGLLECGNLNVEVLLCWFEAFTRPSAPLIHVFFSVYIQMPIKFCLFFLVSLEHRLQIGIEKGDFTCLEIHDLMNMRFRYLRI